ncbi:MAG TPA: LLM class flavin-dependent oxidoreductase [Candidatus Dormibacteraeota bacterium]|nr:LLM class flavin-dependent oxidoreductase [Candidatus Dormibacteraeota bacterium]
MEVGFSIDPAQGLSPQDELDCVRLAAELGYRSAWTPGRGDASAFDRCRAWYQVSGLPTGVAVVPASGQTAAFYSEQATRVWDECGGNFVLGVGSGQMAHPADQMPRYLETLRRLLPPGLPVYVAALGPHMLQVSAELADGVSLNWCTVEQVASSRAQVERAAASAGRPVPPLIEYIRTAVDPDPVVAARVLGAAMLGYALGPIAYRHHFERMGFADELSDQDAARTSPSPRMLSAVGAWGAPTAVRRQFLRLAQGLDCAIVRVLVREPSDVESAHRVLRECRPG